MNRKKHHYSQLSLLEPTFRLSQVPPDIQQTLVDQLAQLLVLVGRPTSDASTTNHEHFHNPENQHDAK